LSDYDLIEDPYCYEGTFVLKNKGNIRDAERLESFELEMSNSRAHEPLPAGRLTSRRWQSGNSVDVQGHISKAGDGDVRHPLYEAANIMLTRFRGFSSLKAWGLKIAKKRGHKRACVAVARKLAVIMHAMWRDGSDFRFKEANADRAVTVAAKLIGVAT
jgi:hypothetical protein